MNLKGEIHRELKDYEPDKRFARSCPRLAKAIHGRKYILPQYRQGDYYSQDKLNADFEFGLIAIGLGALGYRDDVHNAQYANYCAGLHYDRPVMFLERELGEALMRTKLPNDVRTEDIHWRWPQMRIYLPLGLVTIERAGAVRSLLYLDMCQVSADGLMLPKEYAAELEKFITSKANVEGINRATMQQLKVFMAEPYVCMVGAIDYSEVGFGNTVYCYTAPWNDRNLGQMTSYKGGLQTALNCDSDDDAFLDRLKQLAVNILLHLSQEPSRYVPKVIRREQLHGQHLRPALHTASFVGQSQVKPLYIRSHHDAVATGRIVKGHWVCGHRRLVPCGPGRTQRRLLWIQPYRTGHEDED